MIDQQQFRDLMSSVCAPVTVVTATLDGVPHGTTVSAFASLSLDPPMVSVALDQGSALLDPIRSTKRFGINVLGHAQDELAMVFARRGIDRFGAVDWHLDAGLPRLDEAPHWIQCDLDQIVKAGDHHLLFGLVHAASSRTHLPPLIYANRTFGTHSRFAERPRPQIVDAVAACAR